MNLEYVRSNKRMFFEKMDSNIKLIKPNASLYENVTVLPVRNSPESFMGLGGCLNNEGEFISESGIKDACQNYSFGGKYDYNIAECEYVDKSVVYLGNYFKQWGHFLLDSCSRCWYCLENDNIEAFILLVNEQESFTLANNYKEFFNLLGIYDKIIFVNKPTKFKEVIIPQVGARKAEYYSLEQGRVFDKIINSALSIPHESECYSGLYLSRTKLKKNEYGENEILKFFKRNNFKIIYPENESLTKLIQLMANADVCASASGSGASNILLFSKPGKNVLLLERLAIPDAYLIGSYKMRSISLTIIDSNISIFPVTAGGGPFIYSYNKYLDSWAKDNNYTQVKIKKGIYINRIVRKYINKYMDTYPKYIDKWITVDLYDAVKEAYDETYKDYGYAVSKISGLKRLKYLPNMIIESIK